MTSVGAKKCEACDAFQNGIFCAIGPEKLVQFNHYKSNNFYKKGHSIYTQGTPCYGVYCISSGKVKLTLNSPEGRENIIGIATKGDILSTSGLFNEGNNQIRLRWQIHTKARLHPGDKQFPDLGIGRCRNGKCQIYSGDNSNQGLPKIFFP